MICIRYAPGGGCDLSGSPAELRGVAKAVASVRSSVSFTADTTQPPAPYPLSLSCLVVQVGTGLACATVRDSVLHVTAGPKSLQVFASCFDFEDDTPEGYHIHHEYLPGHEHIAAESVPLVIRVHHPHQSA